MYLATRSNWWKIPMIFQLYRRGGLQEPTIGRRRAGGPDFEVRASGGCVRCFWVCDGVWGVKISLHVIKNCFYTTEQVVGNCPVGLSTTNNKHIIF
jgi:hypothetical protein